MSDPKRTLKPLRAGCTPRVLCALPHDRYAPDNVERILRTLLLTKVPPTPKRQQLRTRPGSAQKHDGRSANRWYATEGVSGLLVRDGRLSKAPGDAKACGSRAAAARVEDVQHYPGNMRGGGSSEPVATAISVLRSAVEEAKDARVERDTIVAAQQLLTNVRAKAVAMGIQL